MLTQTAPLTTATDAHIRMFAAAQAAYLVRVNVQTPGSRYDIETGEMTWSSEVRSVKTGDLFAHVHVTGTQAANVVPQ